MTKALRETLSLFDDSGAPQTTTEVANALDLGRRSTYERLERLVDHDQLETKKVGANGRVWWQPMTTEMADQSLTLNEQNRSEKKFRAVFEEAFDAMLIADDDAEYIDVNPAATELFGLSKDELRGQSISEFAAEDYDFEQAWQKFQASDQDRGHFPLLCADGKQRIVEFAATPNILPGRHLSVLRDVTEREDRQRRYDAVFNGTYQFTGLIDLDGTFLEVNDSALEFGGIDRENVIGKKVWNTDWFQYGKAAERVRKAVERARDDEFVRNELEVQGVDRTAITDFSLRPVTDDHGENTYFIMEGRDITDRVEAERELGRRQEQLATLNSVNDIVRSTTDALIDQSSREEIDTTVCEHLASTDRYLFAWISDTEALTWTETLRAGADVKNNLDEITALMDLDEAYNENLPDRALRSGKVQTTEDVYTDPINERRQDHSDTDRIRSSVDIPIIYEETKYGLLSITSERSNAFDEQEQRILGQFGEVIGHAIAATERKQALMSDEILELELRIPDILESIGIDQTSTGQLTLDNVVATSDGAYLVYGTVTPDARKTLDALTSQSAYWDSVTVIAEEDDIIRFEARITDMPLSSEVASRGGSVEEVLLEDGDAHLRLYFSPSADVNAMIETINDLYPTAQLLAKRQIPRPGSPETQSRQSLCDNLTDRQQAALETAYHRGYFEWPRGASGEDLANSLGIAPPTFSQHLRKAEQKVFETVFSSSTSASQWSH
uniref:PAS domain S-box protein n=1 Tax=Haladaptatus litoreus TaxID=553468 RepID=UPI0011156DD7|nr:PAS domain S-box protein [Haladaptatus litoreus]